MDAVRSIRSLAWKPLKMAIRIQDFGMLHVAPDLSGVIPLNAFEAQAASVRDLAAGVMDVSGNRAEGNAGGEGCRPMGAGP